jgi:hypothetical protein
MITQIDLRLYRSNGDYRYDSELAHGVSLSLPYISVNSVRYIYNIILDKDADLIIAYDKNDPRSISTSGIQFGLTFAMAKKEFRNQLLKKGLLCYI